MIGDLEDPGGKERLLATNWEQLGLFRAPCTPSHIILKRQMGKNKVIGFLACFFFLYLFFCCFNFFSSR